MPSNHHVAGGGKKRREGKRGRKKEKQEEMKKAREGRKNSGRKEHVCMCAQSHLTLWDTLDHSPPGSSIHGVFQARMLERVAVFSSRASSWLRDRTRISCIAGRFFTTEPSGKPGRKERQLIPPRALPQSCKVGTLISVFWIEPNCSEYPLISSFLPQPQAWVKSERKHSFRFQPTNHPWDLGEGLALRVGSHRSKQHLEC